MNPVQDLSTTLLKAKLEFLSENRNQLNWCDPARLGLATSVTTSTDLMFQVSVCYSEHLCIHEHLVLLFLIVFFHNLFKPVTFSHIHSPSEQLGLTVGFRQAVWEHGAQRQESTDGREGTLLLIQQRFFFFFYLASERFFPLSADLPSFESSYLNDSLYVCMHYASSVLPV